MLFIITECSAKKISVFSLIDHNSVKGLGWAADLAQQAGIGFIPGIEIDCTYEGVNLHVLGYGINGSSTDFAELEDDICSKVMGSSFNHRYSDYLADSVRQLMLCSIP